MFDCFFIEELHLTLDVHCRAADFKLNARA